MLCGSIPPRPNKEIIMKILNVYVIEQWEIDYKNQKILGMSTVVLNAFDRIEYGLSQKIEIPKDIFAKENWFDEFIAIIRN